MNIKTSISGDFLSRMEARIASITKHAVGATLHAPEELKWWYWNEYGTLPYKIAPVEEPRLVYPQGGQTRFREVGEVVDHPGIAPKNMVGSVIPEIQDELRTAVHTALASEEFNQDLLQEVIADQVMPAAKEKIVESIADKLPGTRPENPAYPKQSGKLHGETAASVFDSQTEIVPLAE